MDRLSAVRDAYSSMLEQYIALFNDTGDGEKTLQGGEILIERHLCGVSGPVLDLGCGPGHWSAYLHSRGVDVTGIDPVPGFIAHAQAKHPGPLFRLGSVTQTDVSDGSVAGVLSWYSTIHLPPIELIDALAHFRRLLTVSGILVVGFFSSDEDVAPFDHAVTTAYRWPVEVFARHLTHAGFTELERVCHQVPERADRKFAAIAARAS